MYIGTQPYQGFRARHTYTATAGQTSFSGAGAENVTLTYSDEMYIDVYQNCLLYTSPSPRDTNPSRMPSSA